ncbi:hypothetical protein VOLCADRAFT_92991 [Volvox carteri f. nagariensis]|uniref:Uncharacterized protein n=1 Tax=Volvox carteri f. nagariensis TaxID=3068 RepID=D8U117_VOLCA|nr:uncharacterized protein VOLCADRAFT_92991 [Volvox carteri f. nagariensis]EFJ46555.1 hypothetical protein VOLCADRAFT_92991 [Volvox carteri f. nagariensis]|eukprot:XP_002952412.1 hypothetical protein VOLCADRAFT_92991 [Volvox carteri f. nagariensis]
MKISGGTQKAAERAAAEERRARRLEQLQARGYTAAAIVLVGFGDVTHGHARLAAAEVNRATSLAQLQRRVAATSQRREDAAERAAAAAAERASVAAERLEAELAAAESRREALRGAELERLRAEHELVLSRLVSSQERAAAGAEQQRSRLEARLRSAASEREARLARRAARAGSKVERARARGAQTREMQQQEIESRRQALEQKLETARRRRQDLRPLPAAASLQSKSPSPSLPSSPIRSPQRSRAAAGGGGDAAPRDLVVAVPSESHSDDGGSSDDATATAAIMATSETDILEAMVADISTAASEGSGGAAAVAADSSDDSGGATAAAAAAAEAEAEAEAEVSSRLEGLRRSISSRRLQQVWREFVQSKRTTRTLAEAFVAQGITNVRLPAAPMPSEAAMAAEDAAARAAGAVDVPRRPGPAPGPAAVNTAAVVIGLGSPSPRGSAAAAAMARMEPQGHSQGDEGGDGFDRFASALRSPTTLKATQALMRRLEQRLEARLAVPSSLSGSKSQHSNQGPSQVQCSSPDGSTSQSPAATSVSRLLRLLYPTAPRNATLERYPPRVLLCAFMIVRHPEVVFSGSGPREVALAAAARDLVDRFETLLERIIFAPAEVPPAAAAAAAAPEPAGPLPWSSPPTYVAASPVARGMEELIRRQRATAAAAVLGGGGSFGLLPPTSPSGSSSPYMTIGSLMVQFDDAWLRYLDQFVAWKGADAASLESELVRCSAALESSMLRKCRGNPFSDRVRRSSDLQAVIAQVAHDQSLLRERIAKLGGEAGLGRLQAALEAARQAVAAELAERGAGGAGSGSGTPSEADTTDAESPSASFAVRFIIFPAAVSPFLARPHLARRTCLTEIDPATPAPLSLDTPPVAAPSPAAAVVPAAASAPIPAPPRPLRPRGELNWPGYVDTDTTPHFGDGGGASGSGVGGAGGGNSTVANSDRGGGGGGGGGGAAVAPSPLSASPKSPGSLRSTLLGPEGAAEGSAVHAVTPLDTALISNAALVHEMLLAGSTGSYRLPTAEAEASWNRAVAAVSLDAGGLAVLHSEAPLEPGELQHMSQEQLIRTLRSRTAAIAECAFWDNVIATLALALQPLPAGLAATRGSSVARLAGVLAPLLSEVAFDVAAIVSPPQQAFALRAEFSESVIRSKITAGAAAGSGGGGGGSSGADGGGAAVVAAVQGALGVLQRLAGLLVAAGAPAREEAALSAQGLMQQRLGAALTEFAQKQQQQPSQDAGAGSDVSEGEGEGEGAALPPPSPLAAALGRAVRLLAAQVKLLRVDAANGRLQALAASLHGDGGVSYLRSKFAAIFRLEGPSGTATAITTTANADAAVAATGPPASPTCVQQQQQPQVLVLVLVLVQSLVDPASGAFRSITNALAAALLAHITLGTPTPPTTQQTQGSVAGASGGGFGGGPAAAVAAMLLGRVGASHLAADVAALGAQLLALCAVNEAVHGELYEEMYGQIMQGGRNGVHLHFCLQADEEEATAAEHPPPHHQHQHQESRPDN